MTRFALLPLRPCCLPCTILLLHFFCAVTFGRQADKVELADGPFQQKSEAMRELIRLKINRNLLMLRREWKSTQNDDGDGDQRDALRKVMMERGFDLGKADRMAEQIVQRSGDSTQIADAFFKLSSGVGGRSSGRSGSGNRSRFHFSTAELSGRGELVEGRILFSFSEIEAPAREFSVRDHADGRFEFRYSGDGFLVELRQQNDGSIRISRIRDDQADVFSAADFVALRKQEPELIDGWLLPLFEHLGFSLPLEADDPAVQQAALTRLDTSATFVAEDFRKLVADLDADEFSVRNTASETLQAHRVLYAEAIRKELDTESLSPEVRTRLASIQSEPVVEDQFEELFREQDLMNSPEFLIGLLEIANADQSQAIFKRLQVLTNEDYRDRKSWEHWLDGRNKNR